MRSVLVLIGLAAWLCFANVAVAQEEAEEAPAPTGPLLQPTSSTPIMCDPGTPSFRFVEIRGSGFDAWATQRLAGSVVNADGVRQIQWSSIWVSRDGRLTLEVNLCADPFRNRPALPAGDYTVSVGPSGSAVIAATNISVVRPAE